MQPRELSNRRPAVFLLAMMALFLFADQNLLAPNLTAIARDFGFDALERDVKLGGQISLGFWILGGLVSLAIGYLSDVTSRKTLFLWVILLGEIPCLLTGFAQTYAQLFWLRTLTGIGIGGAMPLIFSLLGDYYPANRRAAASAYIGLAMALGVAVGQLIAGFIGPTYGWRLPFIVVAVPNFILAAVFWKWVKEPSRGQTEESLRWLHEQGLGYHRKISWNDYRRLFAVPTNRLAFVQAMFGTVPWGVFFIYLNDFYAQEKGFSVETATLIVMFIGLAAIIGGLAGGLIGNALYNRHPRYLPLFCAITSTAGVVPTLLLINYEPAGPGGAGLALPLFFGFLSGFTVALTGPNVRAILLNVNTPETRGSIFSLFNLSDDLGKGLGPALISVFIAIFGRTMALNIATLFWLICGLFLLWMVRTFPRDEQRMQARLAQLAKPR